VFLAILCNDIAIEVITAVWNKASTINIPSVLI